MWSDIRPTYCGYLIFFVLIGSVSIVSLMKDDDVSCEEGSAEDCLKKLQTFLKLKSLVFTSEKAELKELCSRTIAGYNCSATKSAIPNCLSNREKDLFPVFIQMAQKMMYILCTPEGSIDGGFKGDFLKNSECILQQKGALDCCAEASKLTNFPVMYVLQHSSKSAKERQMGACCPIANYLNCALPVVEKNCGEAAANITMQYVRIASGDPTEIVCDKMPDYPNVNTDICETPSVVCSGSRTEILLELVALIIVLIVLRTSYM